MLERTAASLEPCGFQRLLPQRAAHAAFWQNGPLDLDLFTPNPLRTEPLTASTFLFDFLYPRKTLNFLRGASLRRPVRPATDVVPAATRYRPARTYTLPRALDPPASASPARPLTGAYGAAVPDTLQELLQSDVTAYTTDIFDRVWGLYSQLPAGEEKARLARPVLLLFTPSKRSTEAQRIVLAFAALDPAQWDAVVVGHAIRAHLMLKNRADAVALFRHDLPGLSLDEQRKPAGFGALVADALQTSSWDMLGDVWDAYKQKTGWRRVDPASLQDVVEAPNLREKLTKLADHFGSDTYQAQMQAAELAQRHGTPPPDAGFVSVSGVYAAIVAAALRVLGAAEMFPFVEQLQNGRLYEVLIHDAINSHNKELAAHAYAAYRRLPSFRPHEGTLGRMLLHVYRADDVRGVEDVLKDWYNVYGRPSYWGFQKFLAFYAARGDVTSVYRLWNEFTTAYPQDTQAGQDTFAHLLKAHAVRGNLAQVEQVFREIGDLHGATPNTICWNIRLHAHVEQGHFSQAMRVFEELCAAVTPDDYSFATIMALAGSRGDLALVLELYRAARQRGLPVTEAMVDPIVEAYCQNDRYAEAERLCVATTRGGKIAGGQCTALWDTLLQHHAFRHDLVAVNRLLKLMTRLGVFYDDGTYNALLFALAQCRQPRRAVELLRAAQDEAIFRPTAYHYTLLMMAYIRSRQPHRALQVNRLMHHLGFQRSSQQTLLVIKAFSQWQEFPPDVDANGLAGAPTDRRELLAKALREFQRSLAPVDKDAGTRPSAAREAVRMPLGAVRRFSFVVFMLVQARDFVGVEEVMQLYRTLAPPHERQQPLPLKLCNALLLSDYYEGRFDRVKETWQYVFQRTQEIARPQFLQAEPLASLLETAQPPDIDPDSDSDTPVVAKLRYALTDPLKTMQRMYTAEHDADGLVALVAAVRAAGFLLDSKNWNHYVQHLARLGCVQPAFAACEEHLMGQWSGFSVLRARHRWRDGDDVDATSDLFAEDIVPLDDVPSPPVDAAVEAAIDAATASATGPPATASPVSNSAGSARLSRAQQLREGATRYNRPMTHTFMVLAKAYLDLERTAPWSSAAERQFRDLAVHCPKTVHAVRTMVRMNSRLEGRVFGTDDDDSDLLGFDFAQDLGIADPVRADPAAERRGGVP